ncbi:hypothetical protein CKO28_12225 [Rhodovibrio sodomensis]|uniref:DUF2306 domain-containing protein n=1 Tax=Rhodovibrio sodomensis TaxID=1088 RepID=A0ABS1DFS8_9PROT|nr:DUF2306 domain-containing protein [Rhodovibrio sodomensis]MBK1668797.1 hypothetical protein [Rhodovibrio sodomensis]
MTLTPLIAAPPVIQFHVAAATAALLLTGVQLVGRKGGRAHRRCGYAWAAAMLAVAVSGLFIHTIRLVGPFSPIHLLSLVVLVSVPRAILTARAGKVRTHAWIVASLIALALGGAGAFTLWPGRLMHAVLLGG